MARGPYLQHADDGILVVWYTDAPGEGRARIVRFTKRGRAVYAAMIDILHDIEREWSDELGAKRFAELKELLFRVWDSPLSR